MVKHIIFDMDGVIIDSEPEYQKRLKRYMISKGFDISGELYNKICGLNLKMSFEFFRTSIKGFNLDYRDYLMERRQSYEEDPIDPIKIVDPEIYPLLKYLKNKHFHIALASSSPRENIVKHLNTLKIIDDFEFIVSGMEFRESKPNPEIYCYTMKKMGVIPQECLVVEDSTYGLRAAKASGAVVVCKIDNRFGYDQSSADYYVKHLMEIKDLPMFHSLS